MPKITLTPEQFQRITRAIDEPHRFDMLRHIYSGKTVACGEVTTALNMNPGTASHHLRTLEDADLVRVEKVGRFKRLSPRRDVWRAYVAELQQL